ncbi:DNA repair RAD52-like protein 2, chloroplastic [Papaver somniferum]|nr:DNA repair RAD52-like protein 2, chloroplastic [Papaver somniferum]
MINNQIMDLQNTATFLSKPSAASVVLGVPLKSVSSLLFTNSISDSCLFLKKNKNKGITTAAEAVPNSNYVVPLDKSSTSSCITRPLAEILRDLNKKVPDKIIKPDSNCIIPWFHANRMLSFYAPGWCGEIRDVLFSENGNVTVVYRVTVRGSDGEAHRESSGTVPASDNMEDPVAAAEELAFCRACARFGLGLYLYHDDETL